MLTKSVDFDFVQIVMFPAIPQSLLVFDPPKSSNLYFRLKHTGFNRPEIEIQRGRYFHFVDLGLGCLWLRNRFAGCFVRLLLCENVFFGRIDNDAWCLPCGTRDSATWPKFFFLAMVVCLWFESASSNFEGAALISDVFWGTAQPSEMKIFWPKSFL